MDSPGDSSPCGDTTSNDQHCGRCNHHCCGGRCTGGKCQPAVVYDGPLDGGNDATEEIAVSGANVYFSSASYPGLMRISISGGMQPTLIWNKRAVVTGLAADASGVYVAAVDDLNDAGSSGLVEQLAPDGMTGTIIEEGDNPSEIVLDANEVYWRRGKTAIRRWSKTGGSASDVGGTVADLGRIAAARGLLFYHQAPGSRVVQRNPLGMASDIELSMGEQQLSSLAANASYVFWPVADRQKIRRAQVGVRGAIDLFNTGGSPTHIVADGVHVYWLTFGTFGSLRAGRADASGPVIDLTPLLPSPRKLALDASCVYVTTGGAPGRIYRIAKP